ncbi:MAG: peptidylprolyl isomerase [Desulfobulbus sp.]|nr:peptidylprolyl isomerase [Desulfobulbus sp.]
MLRISFLVSSLCFVLISTLFPLPPNSRANVIDRNIAIVNEDTITLSEVNETGREIFRKLAEETPQDQLPAALEEARRAVLNKLIDKKLVVQEAKRLNIQVSDQEVDTALQGILTNNQMTMEQMRQDIRVMGMTEKQYREELREQILSSKLIGHEVRTKVVIPEADILNFYKSHFTTTDANKEYHILQVGTIWGMAKDDGTIPTRTEADDKIKKAHKLALNGKDFGELARSYSDMPSASDDGDLGVFQFDEMAAAMRDAVRYLSPGEISAIVEIDNSFQFFKLHSSQEGTTVTHESYSAVKDQIREKLYQQAMEQRYKEWMTSIRQKAYIKIL